MTLYAEEEEATEDVTERPEQLDQPELSEPELSEPESVKDILKDITRIPFDIKSVSEKIWDKIKHRLEDKVTLETIHKDLLQVELFQLVTQEMLTYIMSATQSDIDTLTTAITALDTSIQTLATTLTADDAGIQAEITALQAQGVDVTNLQAAVAKATSDLATVQTAVAATTALVPAATTTPTVPTTPTTPSATVALDPATSLPLYSYTGTGAVDTTVWTAVSDVTDSAGNVLYTFSGDVAGGTPTGANAEWVPYTGTLATPAPAPTTTPDPTSTESGTTPAS